MITLAIVFTRDNADMIADQLVGYDSGGEELIEDHEWELNYSEPPVLFIDELWTRRDGTFRVLSGVFHPSVVSARNIKFEGDLNTDHFVKVAKGSL